MPTTAIVLLGVAAIIVETAIAVRLVTTNRLSPLAAACLIAASVVIPLYTYTVMTSSAEFLVSFGIANALALLALALFAIVVRMTTADYLTPLIATLALGAIPALIIFGSIGALRLVA